MEETEELLKIAHLHEEGEDAPQITNRYLDLFEKIRDILNRGN